MGIQLSEFLATQERFLCLGFGRRMVLSPGMASSVIIGFRVDAELRHTIRSVSYTHLSRCKFGSFHNS